MTSMRARSSAAMACFASLSLLCLLDTASAGPNQYASIGLHNRLSLARNHCVVPEINESTILTSAFLSTQSYIYVFVCNGGTNPGVGGLEFGLQYEGSYDPDGLARPVDIFAWHLCADSEFPTPDWPNPGSGNRVVWSWQHCPNQPGGPADPYSVFALAGYFYITAYSPSLVRLAPHPTSQQAKVVSCAGQEDTIFPLPTGRSVSLGSVYFSPNASGSGINPCFGGVVVPSAPTTWSHLKAIHNP